jgi:hypothetical protein
MQIKCAESKLKLKIHICVFADVHMRDQPTVMARLVPACDRFLHTFWFAIGVCSTELHGSTSGTHSNLFQPFHLPLDFETIAF